MCIELPGYCYVTQIKLGHFTRYTYTNGIKLEQVIFPCDEDMIC